MLSSTRNTIASFMKEEGIHNRDEIDFETFRRLYKRTNLGPPLQSQTRVSLSPRADVSMLPVWAPSFVRTLLSNFTQTFFYVFVPQDEMSPMEVALERGDKVEVRYGGKSKWYKGKIARVNSNGTFDISYDDGDSERGVRRHLIRPLGGGLKHKPARDRDDTGDEGSDLQRGDKCEARYGGKSKWYPGKISRVNSDGTFDITYDDGDSERRVRASLVRAVGGNGGGHSRSTSRNREAEDEDLQRGDKVEARYGGKSKWYAGKISRVNANGTYDIAYDDGDSERAVRRNMVRLA